MAVFRDKSTIGGRLTYLREKAGLTQDDLADELGYNDKTLASWEVNRHYPNCLVIIDYSDFFHISCDWILKGENR